ncbi:MAG TPA: hypothetical protein VEJ19_07165 [Nitrososphaerales archaeon]|nr:hypothetical protein [Nitrososphaerales archaeon]
MSLEGKVRVVVRSRKVPDSVFVFNQTLYSPSGVPIGTRVNRNVTYRYVLDEDHRRTIEEASKLARRLCLDLEVVDSGKQGILARLLWSIGRRGASNTTVVVSPPSAAVPNDPSSVLTQR